MLRDSAARPLASLYDGILFDLDGVIYRGAQAVPHAPEQIKRLQVPVGFVTNNASRAPGAIAAHLVELGVAATAAQVATSAQSAAAYIRETYGAGTRVLKIGGVGLADAIAASGLTLVDSADDAPEVVVQGASQVLTWADLAEGVYAINSGARYVATNLDSTMPTERGMALGNGALVAAVTHATGVPPEYAAGKPQPGAFIHAADRLEMSKPAIVGDRLDTDIRGAVAAGFDGILVLTGVADAAAAINAAPPDRPAGIIRDLRGLNEPHHAPKEHENRWIACGASAWVGAHGLTVEENGQQVNLSTIQAPVTISLVALRAACAAAWNTPDLPRIGAEIHIAAANTAERG